MTLEVGDKVTLPGDAKPGTVREVAWHGVAITWRLKSGGPWTVWYRNSELEKWSIKKA